MTRKSRREIERKIEELDPKPSDEYPVVDNLAMLLGYEWEAVEGEDQLHRREDTGELYYFDPGFEQAVLDILSDET